MIDADTLLDYICDAMNACQTLQVALESLNSPNARWVKEFVDKVDKLDWNKETETEEADL